MSPGTGPGRHLEWRRDPVAAAVLERREDRHPIPPRRPRGEHLDLLADSPEAAAARLAVDTERLLAVAGDPRELAEVYPEAPALLTGPRLVLAGVLQREAATLVAYLGFADDLASVRSVALGLRTPVSRALVAPLDRRES